MYYVYLLQSEKDGKYYIGHSKDVFHRLEMHNRGLVNSTRQRLPMRLVGFESYKTRNGARWAEYNLKNHSDKKSKFIFRLNSERPPVPRVVDPKVSDPEGLRPGGR